MSRTRRILSIIVGIIMILSGIFLMLLPEIGYSVIILVLGIGLAIRGINRLWNFLTLSLRSVGSTRLLYDGILILDVGIFTTALANVPVIFLMIYLAGVYLFSGVIDILSALDSKRLESPYFKVKLAEGLGNVFIAVLCLIFIRNQDVVVYIYGAGIIYNGIVRIFNAFRRTEMVFEEANDNSNSVLEDKA